MGCNAYMMRRAHHARKSRRWEGIKEELREKGEISEWACAGSKEAYDKVASEDVGRLSIAQDRLRKSTDFLKKKNIERLRLVWSVTLSFFCPNCNCFPWEDYIWSVSSRQGDGNDRTKKQCSWWCAACGDQYDWRAPNRILVMELSANAHEAKVFKAHAAPQGLCDYLINALKLLANQQKDGDSPIESIVTGLHEKSRKRCSVLAVFSQPI